MTDASAPSPVDAPTVTPQQFVGWFFQPDRLLGWKMVPDQAAWFEKPGIRTFVRTNALGFRGPDFPAEKPPGERRVLLLADSFGVAIEVDEAQAFPALLQSALDRRSAAGSPSCTLLNASVGGYGTEQELLYFRERGRHCSPDLVLLAFHFGDDLIENSAALRRLIPWRLVKLPRPHFSFDPGDPFRLVGAPRPAALRRAWAHYYDYLPPAGRSARYASLCMTPADRVARLFQRLLDRLQKRLQDLRRSASAVPLDLRIYAARPEPAFEQTWSNTRLLLEALQREVTQAGARLLVAGVCTKEQVVPGYFQKKLGGRADVSDFDLSYPNRRLAALLDDLGVPFADLTPAFLAATRQGETLFHEYDLHWNARGHARAGERLSEALEACLS